MKTNKIKKIIMMTIMALAFLASSIAMINIILNWNLYETKNRIIAICLCIISFVILIFLWKDNARSNKSNRKD